MKRFYRIGPILLFSLCFFSCSTSPDSIQKQVDELDKKILATHDEVMPLIGKVLNLRKKVQSKLDSCSTQICKDSLQQITYALTKADADMMHWMHHYNKPEGLDTAVKYLESQSLEIDKVKMQILGGIEKAEEVLQGKKIDSN